MRELFFVTFQKKTFSKNLSAKKKKSETLEIGLHLPVSQERRIKEKEKRKKKRYDTGRNIRAERVKRGNFHAAILLAYSCSKQQETRTTQKFYVCTRPILFFSFCKLLSIDWLIDWLIDIRQNMFFSCLKICTHTYSSSPFGNLTHTYVQYTYTYTPYSFPQLICGMETVANGYVHTYIHTGTIYNYGLSPT